jgi:hypothetical protein
MSILTPFFIYKLKDLLKQDSQDDKIILRILKIECRSGYPVNLVSSCEVLKQDSQDEKNNSQNFEDRM